MGQPAACPGSIGGAGVERLLYRQPLKHGTPRLPVATLKFGNSELLQETGLSI